MSACLVLVPLVMGAAPANAVVSSNTAPDCSYTAQNDFPADAIEVGGNQSPSALDFVWSCNDAEGDALTITATTDGAHGTTVVMPADTDHPDGYLQYTPVEGFHGRDELQATVSDGSLTAPATIYVHVVRPTDFVDCGPTTVSAWKWLGDAYDYTYLPCYTSAPDSTVTYAIDSVTPNTEAGNVLLHDVDPGDGSGTPIPTITFSDQVDASQVTVQVTGTDGTGASDTFSIVLDNRHDPVCTTAADANGYVNLEQRSSNHGALTQDLGCSDPDGTPLTYSAPTYYPPNSGDTAPGTLSVSSTGVVTFVPTDPNWTGWAYFTGGEVTDGNEGWHGLDILVQRYQQADLSASFTVTPASVTIGSSYTATMHVANAGPDAVSGAYFDIGLPTGSVIGALPSGCTAANGYPYVGCSYTTIASGTSFDVSIPITAGPGSTAGVNQIGTQFAAANLRNTNPAGGVASATVTLGSGTAVVPGNQVVRGSAAGTTITTGAGNDGVDAGPGNDLLLLGAGDDCGQGGAGNDTAHGQDGNDALYGDAGPCVTGKASTSRMTAAVSGNDRIFGDAGNDRLFGGPGADFLKGGSGKDTYVGGPGNDIIRARDHVRGERINCGAGRDTVYADKGDVVARNCERVHRG
ncbi:Ig-like domain-containing protein [Nocardioides pocheonensis]|uniref:Ig-like domain-containing protein n=1 Tax=Nocardioides pocheonensis TaxID=661485 RepID=UPI00161F9D84|nr:cadherin-like domain-containing protein [Nocardioides pocheonensis]